MKKIKVDRIIKVQEGKSLCNLDRVFLPSITDMWSKYVAASLIRRVSINKGKMFNFEQLWNTILANTEGQRVFPRVFSTVTEIFNRSEKR